MKVVDKILSSIRNKMIVLLLAATIIPIFTSIIITYNYTKGKMQEQVIAQNKNLIYEGKSNLNFYFDVINNASLAIYNRAILKVIEQDYNNDSSETEISKLLFELFSSVKEAYQVDLYIKNNQSNYLINNYLVSSRKNRNFKIKPTTKPFNAYIEAPHMNNYYGFSKIGVGSRKKVISIHRPIYKIPSKEILGLLSIDIKLDEFKNICRRLYKKGHEQLYIIDSRDGKLLYDSKEKDMGKKSNGALYKRLKGLKKDRGYFDWKSGQNGVEIYDKLTTPYVNWIIVKQIPHSYLNKSAVTITTINSLVIFIFLLIAVVITLVISIRITRPIKQIIHYTREIEKGDLNIDIQVRSKDEFGILEKHFKKMMNTINTLILKEYKLEIENKTYQLKALQAQIDPHFINNSLQSIGTLALQHNETKIYFLITSLGKMLSYNMNMEENIVPLSKEVAQVKSYLELQKQRFEDMLDVEFDIDPMTEEVDVPKMILQPFIENYFKHGFDRRSSHEGHVFIRSKINKKKQLVIYITDNGSGISEDKLEVLNSQIRGEAQEIPRDGKHIGIMNVVARLNLYFGEGACVKLENLQSTGLKVTICIPIQREVK